MKTLLKTLLFAVCCGIGFTACDSDEHSDVLTDFFPIELMIYVEDANGNDLLNPAVPGNISESNIVATYKGESYEKDAQSVGTRVYIPVFYGLKTGYSEKEGKYYLMFGEFDRAKAIEDEKVTILWGQNGMADDEIVFSNKVKWNGGEKDAEQSFYLNGKKNPNSKFVIKK